MSAGACPAEKEEESGPLAHRAWRRRGPAQDFSGTEAEGPAAGPRCSRLGGAKGAHEVQPALGPRGSAVRTPQRLLVASLLTSGTKAFTVDFSSGGRARN